MLRTRVSNPGTKVLVRRSAVERICAGVGALLLLASCAVDVPGSARLSPEPPASSRAGASKTSAPDLTDDFVRRVVADLDATWARDFHKRGKPYTPMGPTLFAEAGSCAGSTETGSCPDTVKPDIDLLFQRRLRERFGDAGKAPQAYAIAHQAGHHLQRLMGIDTKVREVLAAKPVATHAVQIQLELQADCLAGVWMRTTGQRELLLPADADRALRQAAELGKDRRLEQRRGDEPPGESFTYAIPRQRGYWFYQGYSGGQLESCDTFARG